VSLKRNVRFLDRRIGIDSSDGRNGESVVCIPGLTCASCRSHGDWAAG
jgi:hypothetical protein